MTNDEFLEWKNDPRTKEIFVAIESECFDIAKLLSRTAGIDSQEDRYQVGVIRGMERILEIAYEESDA